LTNSETGVGRGSPSAFKPLFLPKVVNSVFNLLFSSLMCTVSHRYEGLEPVGPGSWPTVKRVQGASGPVLRYTGRHIPGSIHLLHTQGGIYPGGIPYYTHTGRHIPRVVYLPYTQGGIYPGWCTSLLRLSGASRYCYFFSPKALGSLSGQLFSFFKVLGSLSGQLFFSFRLSGASLRVFLPFVGESGT